MKLQIEFQQFCLLLFLPTTRITYRSHLTSIPKKLYNGQTLVQTMHHAGRVYRWCACYTFVEIDCWFLSQQLFLYHRRLHKRQCTTQQLLQRPRGHTPRTPWCNRYSNSTRPSRTTTPRHRTHRTHTTLRTHRTHRHRTRERRQRTPRPNDCHRRQPRPTKRQRHTLALGDWAALSDEAPRDVSD